MFASTKADIEEITCFLRRVPRVCGKKLYEARRSLQRRTPEEVRSTRQHLQSLWDEHDLDPPAAFEFRTTCERLLPQ